MKIEFAYDSLRLQNIVVARINNDEVASILRPEVVADRIVQGVANAVVVRVMDKLGPAIGKALAEAAAEFDKPAEPAAVVDPVESPR